MNNIREYLCSEAQRITDGALADFTDRAAWERLLPQRREQYREMMGLTGLLPEQTFGSPAPFTVTGVVERPAYHIEKLCYQSLPDLYVTANLYVPHGLTAPAPGVLYLCGHAQRQKVHYQAHPRRFAELGFVCLLIETVQLGEAEGYHHGCYREGWFHWYSRGYSPAGVELLNGMRGLDLLTQRSEVDAARLGVTGISGGGTGSWWVAAADERVRVAAPVCGTAALASQIRDRTIDGHCDCMWWNNIYRWDMADIGALVAPRPLMIASADRDAINTIAAIREVHQQLERLYGMLGVPENLRLVETPGPHSYHERSRTAIFSFFLKHLADKDIAPEQVGDIDDSPQRQESEETLRVFTSGSPRENRTPVIHDQFIPLPEPPRITDRGTLEKTRQEVVAALREKSFGAFPTDPPPLNLQVESEFAYRGGGTGAHFAFTPEAGWRLRGRIILPRDAPHPAPVVVGLRAPGENREATDDFIGNMNVPWARAVVEPRGTGATAWGAELQWHVRRASAWTGRTVAGMRVWDTLRALEAVRALSGVDSDQVALAAQGEMAAVALYAALLDGRVSTLFLESPPATQNAPGSPDGRGLTIEMLNCLRITDLPQVAGLLWPTELVVIGDCPPEYAWTEQLYAALGAPGAFRQIPTIGTWQAG